MQSVSLRRRTVLIGALIALTLAYGGLVLVTSRWLSSKRFDLTQDGLYTLSSGTRQIVDNIDRPLSLTLYFSQHAAKDLPQLRSYEQRVVETLQEIVARSHNRIRLQIADPIPYSDDEASAEGNGLTPVNGGSHGERIFFGLIGTTRAPGNEAAADSSQARQHKQPDRTLSIPFFDPNRETFLEYDIAQLLYQLSEKKKPRIGVVTDLPVMGDPAQGTQPWAVMRQLQQLFDVERVGAEKLTRIGKSIPVLLLIHPKHLSVNAQYALDQFVLGGGRLVVFVDPFSESDPTPLVTDATYATNNHSSNLPRLFAAWGVSFNPDQIVLDRSRALQIELAGTKLAHPAMLGLGASELNHADAITASLQRINVSTAGHFDLLPEAHTRLIPLMQSSLDAEVVPTQRVIEARNNPSSLLDGYLPQDQNYVIAACLRGPFVSAFPEFAKRPGHLSASPSNAQVILVADTDLLTDRLWIEAQNFLGQPMLSAFTNNGDFISNMVDNLTGSSALLSIRGRTTLLRPFTRVQALRRVADREFLKKERELQSELAYTKRRLEQLQPNKGASDTSISAQQRQEIEQFLQRQLTISKQLREVQQRLNADIDALGTRLKVINILLIPAVITLAGLMYGWKRTRWNRGQRD